MHGGMGRYQPTPIAIAAKNWSQGFLQQTPFNAAESWQNMRLSFVGALAVFHSTTCIKDSSSFSIVPLSRQPFCSLRSIQSGPAAGRLVVSEKSFFLQWIICSFKLIKLNPNYAFSQLKFRCLCCILQVWQSVGEIVWELRCCSLCDEIQGKCKKKTKLLNILDFSYLAFNYWSGRHMGVESQNFSLFRLEST